MRCITGFQIIICLSLLACLSAQAQADEPTTQPSGSVMGKVTSPSEVPLSEMVVFLESPDTKRVTIPPAAHAAISQKGAKFSPPLLILCVGQTVDFLNDEDRPIDHNVFSNAPAKRFDLGLYKPGESRSVMFDKPGPVFLYCSIHRYMDGVIFVSPTPYSSLVAPNGSYRIDNVPPGIWLVKTWQRRRRFSELSVPVLLEAGKTATTDLELRKK
jgi:plastocyanin